MRRLKNVRNIVLHDGVFHGDDIMAAAFVKAILPDANIIRTRDITHDMIDSSEYLIAGVGGLYDPSKLLFDNHQIDTPSEDNGHRYAAFGQIYKEFGHLLFPKK